MDLRGLTWVLCVVTSGLGGCMDDYQPMRGETYEGAPEPGPYDPFAGELPAAILDAQTQQRNGKLLGIPIQRELYELGTMDSEDPRPWLLLARDSMARDWVGFAMRQYGSALAADRRVTRVDGVLDDVLNTALTYTGVEESDAIALLEQYWGLDALPEIDRATAQMQAEGRVYAVAKLAAMRESLIEAAR